ncbi:MAG: MaoC family dehydratase [Pseudomonadota bacterium]|nr:MaoC family dehydratase [Pseudomonadota bacterium]
MSSVEKSFQAMKTREGRKVGASSWTLVDQGLVNEFAALTGDDQFIHLDESRAAAETPFGGTIAHGFLILSLISKFALEALPNDPDKSIRVNYGFDKIRFISPVMCGSRVRGHFALKNVGLSKPKELRQVYNVSIEIERFDRLALVADWILLTIFDN